MDSLLSSFQKQVQPGSTTEKGNSKSDLSDINQNFSLWEGGTEWRKMRQYTLSIESVRNLHEPLDEALHKQHD